VDPFALPCHPDLAVSPDDRDWRAVGVRTDDAVTRKQTRCPRCTTSWTAYLRSWGPVRTVEWVRPTPFRVTAVPVEGDDPQLPVWQDAAVPDASPPTPLPPDRVAVLAGLQEQTAGLGPAWERSVQLVAPAYDLVADGLLAASAGELLLERRAKWNAQDRRLALLWAPRLGRPVVSWHGAARLLQEQ
jgi:hypothetical protein